MNFLKLPFLALMLGTGICSAAEQHPSLPAAGSLDGFGVNIHFTHQQPGELAMIREAGFKWVRMDLTWSATEKEKGKYDFSAYEHLVKGLEGEGIKAYFILDYGNSLYANPGEKHPFTERADEAGFRAAFSAWAAAAVKHFAGKGYLWEIWNEPNISGFWKPEPEPEVYAALAKDACAAIAKVAPGEAIVGAATSTVDLPFLETCFKAGLLEDWAAVSVHPYRQTPPETAAADYEKLKALIAKYAPEGKAIPILSGEWGYSTGYPCMAGKNDAEREDMQADYLLRMMLTNIANDIPVSIWYDWRDDGDDPEEAEHRFGIVRRPYRAGMSPVLEPKPAYLQIQRFTKMVGENPAMPASEILKILLAVRSESTATHTGFSGVPALSADAELNFFADGDKSIPASANITADAGDSGSPVRSWTLKYQTEKGWRFFNTVTSEKEVLEMPADKRASALGWWVLGNGSNLQTRMRFIDSTGQTFQSSGPMLDFKGWRFISMPLDHRDEHPLAYWGGAKDGVIHYPIRLDSVFILDNVKGTATGGEIKIASPMLIY